MADVSLRKLSESGSDKIQKGFVKRRNMYGVAFEAIKPTISDNLRNMTRENVQQHIQNIYLTIMNSKDVFDDIQPLELFINDKGELDINDGFCRWTAFGMAIKAGKEIELVPAMDSARTPSGRTLKMLKRGKGSLALTPLENGVGYARMMDEPDQLTDDGERWTIETIAAEMCVTTESVKQLLILGRATPDVQAYVDSEVISAHTAIDLIRVHGDKTGKFIAAQLKEAAARGDQSNKITKGSLNGRALPKKVVSGLVESLHSFGKRLDKDTRHQLASLEKLPPEQLKGKTVTVDAAAMLELMRAKDELDKTEKNQKDRARAKAEKAGQAKLEV